MTDLLPRLETEEGSRELDALIEPDNFVWAQGNGGRYKIYKMPHYTTSLDAKLPGENIVKVEYDAQTKIWTAWQHTSKGATLAYDIHGITTGEAKTEILARRAAVLRARG